MDKRPILIIEDDQDDCDLITNAIKELGLKNELKFFHNGLEALKYLKATTSKVFLILSDINMPLMNGLDLKQSICKDAELADKGILFVFFSAAAITSEIKKAYKYMAQGFFIKPHDFAGLKNLLKVVIDYWKLSKHPNASLV